MDFFIALRPGSIALPHRMATFKPTETGFWHRLPLAVIETNTLHKDNSILQQDYSRKVCETDQLHIHLQPISFAFKKERMRKLKLQVQMTIDGFISGQNGEMDWMQLPWTDDILNYVREITEPVDTIVLGRKLAEGFIPHWTNVAKDPSNPEYEGGVKYTTTQKIVFTKTLDKSIWENTEIAHGDLVEEINSLKRKSGKDIIAYGGGEFVSSLIKNKLIDELHLFVNPAAIGKGMPIFNELSEMQKFSVMDVHNFECGIVVMVYKPI